MVLAIEVLPADFFGTGRMVTSLWGDTLVRFGSDGVAAPKYVELGGDAVNGVLFTTHFSTATGD